MALPATLFFLLLSPRFARVEREKGKNKWRRRGEKLELCWVRPEEEEGKKKRGYRILFPVGKNSRWAKKEKGRKRMEVVKPWRLERTILPFRKKTISATRRLLSTTGRP